MINLRKEKWFIKTYGSKEFFECICRFLKEKGFDFYGGWKCHVENSIDTYKKNTCIGFYENDKRILSYSPTKHYQENGYWEINIEDIINFNNNITINLNDRYVAEIDKENKKIVAFADNFEKLEIKLDKVVEILSGRQEIINTNNKKKFIRIYGNQEYFYFVNKLAGEKGFRGLSHNFDKVTDEFCIIFDTIKYINTWQGYNYCIKEKFEEKSIDWLINYKGEENKKIVSLNDKYRVELYKDYFKVNCQTFQYDVLENIVKEFTQS